MAFKIPIFRRIIQLREDLLRPQKMAPFRKTRASESILIEKAYWNSMNRMLREAILKDDDKLVEHLLKKGANPNTRYENGITPLMLAAINDNAFMIELLHEFGADLYMQDQGGWTVKDYIRSKKTEEALAFCKNMKRLEPPPIWTKEWKTCNY